MMATMEKTSEVVSNNGGYCTEMGFVYQCHFDHVHGLSLCGPRSSLMSPPFPE